MRSAIPIKDLEQKNEVGSSVHRFLIAVQQTVYELIPPFEGEDGEAHVYVVVSAVKLKMRAGAQDFSLETYIFPSNKSGEFTYSELPGSSRGTLSHQDVLASIGYEIHQNSIKLIRDLLKGN
ncbi:hypothetical protein WDW86_15435 [Bdellovibrionota bacterium FG-2]